MAVRSAWQLGSLGVAAQAASFCADLGAECRAAGQRGLRWRGWVPGTTPVADGWFTRPGSRHWRHRPAATPWSCEVCAIAVV